MADKGHMRSQAVAYAPAFGVETGNEATHRQGHGSAHHISM